MEEKQIGGALFFSGNQLQHRYEPIKPDNQPERCVHCGRTEETQLDHYWRDEDGAIHNG